MFRNVFLFKKQYYCKRLNGLRFKKGIISLLTNANEDDVSVRYSYAAFVPLIYIVIAA